MALTALVCKQSKSDDAYTNQVFLNPVDWMKLADQSPKQGKDGKLIIELKLEHRPQDSFVFTAVEDRGVEIGKVALNGSQRDDCHAPFDAPATLTPYNVRVDDLIDSITLTVDLKAKPADDTPALEIDAGRVEKAIKKAFSGQVLTQGQSLIVKVRKNLILRVQEMSFASFGDASSEARGIADLKMRGQYDGKLSSLILERAPNARVRLSGGAQDSRAPKIFNKAFDFQQLGIGGLDAEFNQIFRRTFASRMYPAHVVEQLGIIHVKGMLLFGPPGCGKTLIARQIGKVLNAREPKIVNGPEILDRFVGGSEEKIRELFADAEQEQKMEGSNSMLHIVIFDEFDAICKSRGSTGDNTGVNDSIVNQLLAKIDGVDALNNILIIGMTNRKDMIDDAILRPGRLEVHVEIGLPDVKGRLQILNIHTAKMRNPKHRRMSQEAEQKLGELAERTKNFSGAELAGLVRSATSNALHRNFDSKTMQADVENVTIEYGDFDLALQEVKPAFGAPTENLQEYFPSEWVSYNEEYEELLRRLQLCVEQVKTSERTSLLTVLLEGDTFTGKTALAARVAVESGFPFVRMVSADGLIGKHDSYKSAAIQKAFMDASKSQFSVIILDDLERLIEYTPVGPRFSNMVLQTLLVMLKKPPRKGSSLLVVATTSVAPLLEQLQLTSAFNITLSVPKLDQKGIRRVLEELVPMDPKERDEVCGYMGETPIAIKQLLMVSEMARQGEYSVSAQRFMECLHTIDYV